MFNELVNHLTALEAYLKQVHLLAASKGYATHLLFERLYEPIGADIDRLKEVALALGEPRNIAYAETSLKNAAEILAEYPTEDLNEMILASKRLEMLIISLIETVGKQATEQNVFGLQGVLNMLGDISEKRLRDVYLINTQI